MKRSEIIFGALRLPVDFMAITGAFLLAYYLRPITDLIPGVQYAFGAELRPPFADYLELTLIATTFLMVLMGFNHLYSLKITHRFGKEVVKIIFWVSTWLMFIIAYYFLVVHQLFFSRIALAHIWLFTIAFLITGRLITRSIQHFLLRYGVGKRRILFIGANANADRFYKSIQKDPYYTVIGAVDDQVVSRKKEALKIIGTIDQLEVIVDKYKVEEIIQTDPHLKDAKASQLHEFCRSHQIKYHFIPDLVRLQRTNVEVEMVGEMPLVSLKDSALDGWGHIFKRLFDIIFSSLILIGLLPLWVLIALLIKLDSKGPIIYKSKRKHKNKVFWMYKFRSMVSDADSKKAALLKENERSGPLFKIKNDPRITRVGRVLRKTSLDEFPQFINVLLGQMSLVGPRPHLPEEIDQYETHHHKVFALKPGVTGLAQVSGRSNLDFEEEVKLDIYYIENWSLFLDIKLIFKSIGVIFRADGE